MELEIWQYALLFGLICFGGFIDSIAGGGGLITIPAYLVTGVPTHNILGTNKCVSSAGASIAVLRYVRSGLIYWHVIPFSIVAAMLGSMIGARMSGYIDRHAMVVILLVVIPVLLYLQSKKSLIKSEEEAMSPTANLSTVAKVTAIGLVIGSYDGVFGPGTGTFLLLAFGVFGYFSPKHASANARIVNYASNLGALSYFMYQGQIQWAIAGIGIVASITGNYLGSGLVINKSGAIVQPVFKLVLTMLMLKSIYDIWVINSA